MFQKSSLIKALSWKTNNFFKAPDGEKPFQKIYTSFKVTSGVGILLGLTRSCLTDANMYNHITVGRVIHTTFPIVGFGFLFASGTFIAGNLRKKDDDWNHIIGALTTAPLVRKFFSFHTTVVIVTYMCILAAVCKSSIMHLKTEGFDINKELKITYSANTFDWYYWSKTKPPNTTYLDRKLFW
ncbi:PREDICTED: uncharacterized protein LOC108574563 [Habropoda laboriosa]|nr:PREDICTED: uncharacterized protein LOC108574563 [Habropoda laboriosa]